MASSTASCMLSVVYAALTQNYFFEVDCLDAKYNTVILIDFKVELLCYFEFNPIVSCGKCYLPNVN